MGKKSSIYFGPVLIEHTSGLETGDSVSGRINRTAERYVEVCKRHGIELSDDERIFLANILMGSFVDPLLIRHLPHEIRDSDKSGDINLEALAEKIENANFADRVALVESLGF